MVTIRMFEERDVAGIGRLIADTYSQFNLSFLPEEQVGLFLGPFQHAYSDDPEHIAAIANVVRSEIVLVAEADDGVIVGVLRGRKERLASLFVRGDFQRQGIGRQLVQRFEEESIKLGVKVIRLSATLFAVPFYLAMGYKRSTNVRIGWSFEGRGLPNQPMRKVLDTSQPALLHETEL
jgi:GNAT superfamily N-acetyltransferase